VGPIYTVEDIVADEQYEAREMLLEAEVEGVGTVRMPGLAPKLSETPGAVGWYGGALGAHNEEIYGGLLALSADEIGRLAEEGAILWTCRRLSRSSRSAPTTGSRTRS
jgi:crotonobetainyl-CoA:carnitine CoA-transferase CaiB-like acyl-CoA transferase